MIADPMADLTGEGTPGPANEMSSQKEVFNPMVLQVNMQRVDRIRSIMGIASGCVAGTLGLTGLQGLGKWIATRVFLKPLLAGIHTLISLITFQLVMSVSICSCQSQPGLLR